MITLDPSQVASLFTPLSPNGADSSGLMNALAAGMEAGAAPANQSAKPQNGQAAAAGSASGQSGAAGQATPAKKPNVPTAPWSTGAKSPQMSDLVRKVLTGGKFIDETAAQLDVPGASEDYRKLFAVYQGLNALEGLSQQAAGKGVGPTQLAELQKTFASGMQQVTSYLKGLKFDQFRLTEGSVMSKDAGTVGVPADGASSYKTRVLYTGDPTAEVPAFQGDVAFDAAIKRGTTTTDVSFDLSEMGAAPRTMSNVVAYLNSKLQAAGVRTRFAVDVQPGQPRTVQAGKQTVNLPPGPSQYSLTVKGDSAEELSFSAPAAADAVYVTQAAGKSAPDQQLLKFQTDVSTTASAPPAAQNPQGQAFSVDGRAFAQSLGPNIAGVRASATGADGAVYVLADVTGAVNGEPIQGDQDVALMKYDSAGQLQYSRTLGAGDTATGLSLAVAADGKVAVAGAVTGTLDPSAPPLQTAQADGFVTVFDDQGQQLWTQRRGGLGDDRITGVAFGPNDSVFVAGDSHASPGANAGPLNGFVEGYVWNGKTGDLSKVQTVLSQSLAGIQAPKLAADGQSLYVAGAGSTAADQATVYGWTLAPNGQATAIGGQALGTLGQGGQVAAVAIDNASVIVAGTAADPSRAADQSQVPQATNRFGGGGSDGFVAQLSTSLQPSPLDAFSYVGGAGGDRITGLAVANGQVYVAGTTPNAQTPASQDGFVARVDPSSGASGWSAQFTAQDGQAAPTSIAAAASGASVLDRLGLPSQVMPYSLPPADQLTAAQTLVTTATSARAGDQFYVRTSEGGTPTAVTIAADDTFATLAQKVNRALGFQGQASFTVTGSGKKSLQIGVTTGRQSIEVLPGKPGIDALGPLGLKAGLIQQTPPPPPKSAPPTMAGKVYGLQLNPNLSLSDPASIKAAQTALQNAMTIIQGAYVDLKTAANPPAKTTNADGSSTVPAYLTSELSNYQAALQRLTQGGSTLDPLLASLATTA